MNIIRRMTRIFRMWRFLRVLEQLLLSKRSSSDGEKVTDVRCAKEFVKLRTVFRRRSYSPQEALVAYSTAIDMGIILNDGRPIATKSPQELAMTGRGWIVATPTGLLNIGAEAIVKISSVVSVLIATLALVVSLYVLRGGL